MPPMPSFIDHMNAGFSLSAMDGQAPITAGDLRLRVRGLALELGERFPCGSLIGLYADNSPDWAVADLALQEAQMVAVPLPGFFSQAQLDHVVRQYPLRGLLCSAQSLVFGGRPSRAEPLAGTSLVLHVTGSSAPPMGPLSPGSKLTFTSGSTGTPKGIVLSPKAQWTVADSVAQALRGVSLQRHLTLLPMAVLLENVAGLYTSMRMGGQVVIPGLASVGLSGSSGFDPRVAIRAVAQSQSESVILLPQMLKDMVTVMKNSAVRLPDLKFVAVGGGKVPEALISEARGLGLPVYEGYGLTEAASVVCLNVPRSDRPGSVGRPLAHQRLRVDADGEIKVRLADGAEDRDGGGDGWIDTGDLGSVDQDGFLHITGRKKNVLITGFGRNVSPEWPESLLMGYPEIAQAMVYGEGSPHLRALVVPQGPEVSLKAIGDVLQRVNDGLPDYARILEWTVLAAPFSVRDGTLTANGRLKRDAIAQRHLQGVASTTQAED